MTDALVPPPPRMSRAVQRSLRITAAAGVLLVVGYLIAIFAAHFGGASVDERRPYVWRSDSTIYLVSGSRYRAATCSITSEDSRLVVTIQVPRGPATDVRGVRINRPFSGSPTVTCDTTVLLSSGPALWLYPLAYWDWILLIGILPIVFWSRARRWPTRIFGLPGLIVRRRRSVR